MDVLSRHSPSVGILIREDIPFSIIPTPADECNLGIKTFCKVPLSLFSYYDSIRLNKLNRDRLLEFKD